MYVAGTRVKLLTELGGHPAGTLALVVYDLGANLCEVILETGEHLTVDCSALQRLEEAVA
jgi:hypothetical protein